MEKDYKQEVISLIDNCSNDNFLKFLFELVTSFKKSGAFNAPLSHTNKQQYQKSFADVLY